jgi:membrane-associated protease RseP (regulator of RpoE activity)
LSFDFEFFKESGVIADRLEFTIALMDILLFHEFGHYLAGKRRGVLMSLPYFLPAPNFIGTFGAVIKSRTPFTNRRDLIEVGAAGPIAGFVVSLIALAIGLNNTEIIQVESGGLILGDSLLLKFLAWLIVGPIPEGFDFVLSPAAFAGWVGLLVTTINLLPLGQLDGGHIIYGLIGPKQRSISRLFIVFMMILGFWWQGWWFFGILVFLFGLNHPPTLNDSIPISNVARIMGLMAVVIFLICFIPVPFVF